MSAATSKAAGSNTNPLIQPNVKQNSSKPKTFISKITKPKVQNQNGAKKKVIKV